MCLKSWLFVVYSVDFKEDSLICNKYMNSKIALRVSKYHGVMALLNRTSDRAGRARAPTHAHPVFDSKVPTPTRPARAKKRNGRPPAHWASV